MRKYNTWHFIGLIGSIILVLGVIFYLFIPNFFTNGMFFGGDEAAHMFIPKYAVDYYQIHQRFPIINPYWYNGIELLHHAPALDYIPIAIIYILTKDIYLTDRIFTLLLLFAAGLSMFYLLYAKKGMRSAIIGGILYPFAPGIFYLARTSLTRVTPFILYPLAFYFSDKILEEDNKFRNFLFLIIIITAMILSHPITGLSSIIIVGLYVFLRILLDRKIESNKLWIWFSTLLIACGLTAWYAVPFLLEPTNYSYPASSVISDIKGTKMSDVLVMAGTIPIIILGLFSFWRRRTPKNWALIISVLIAFFFVTPLSILFYQLFPWGYPFAAFIWICIVMIYWTATSFEDFKINPKAANIIAYIVVPIIIAVGLFSFNYRNSFVKIWVEPFERAFPALEDAFNSLDNPGRAFYIKTAGKLDWVVPAISHKYFSEGHYFSINRLNKEIAWINDAFNNGYYSYVTNKMDLFNDRYFIYTKYTQIFFEKNPDLKPAFEQTLEQAGYKQYFSNPGETISALYYKDEPSSYLIPLKEKTLLIGQYSYNYSAFQPKSYIAGSIYLDDYDLEFISNFDNLVLYGFGYHDKGKAEELISDYSRGGGNVVIDMLNVQSSKLESEPTFLGVQSVTSRIDSSMKLEFAQNVENNILPPALNLPSAKDFGAGDVDEVKETPLIEWRFSEYSNLDSSLVRWDNRSDADSGLYSLVGYKNIDGHKVWFIGGNLFYHAYLTHNPVEQDFIKKITSENSDSKSADQSKISITSQNLDPEAGKMEFSYSAEKTTPLLISYTISPHWKAYLNDQPIKIYNIDSMMAVNLPAGDNYVNLKYENLPNHYLAKGITVATLILLGAIFFVNLRRKKDKKNV